MTARTRTRRRTMPARKPTIRRLPLGSLRVFLAVADHLSFTRAASDLGCTVSAASMQIQALEDYLGLPLFRRGGRLVELSAEGAQLLPKIRTGLNALQSAIDDARVVRGSGALRISTLHSFLLQWLLPRLPDFEKLHPDIHLQMETSNDPVDFNKTGMHAAVRFGGGSWPGLHAEKLLDEWLVPVCQPQMLKKLGPINDHDDLQRYRLLHSSTEPWAIWLSGSPDDCWPESGVGFDDSTAIVRAAEAGAGLALARWSLVANEVRHGSLVIASRHVTPYARSYYFVCLPRALQLKKVAALREWLLHEAARHPAPQRAVAGSG
jgi:LysR family glycine cleavage system transcriptional activator